MYAETFTVRPWLEEPAKWLRWAQQSLAARNLEDTRHNLQQFWTGLAGIKTKASTPLDWAEVLTLDAQSQQILGNLYGADLSELLQDMNRTKLISSTIYFSKEADYKAKQFKLQSARDAALKASLDLARQATKAYADAKIPATAHQAGNTVTVATGAVTRAAGDRAYENRMSTNISSPIPPLELLKEPWFGVPLWAWLAGGAALLLIITTAPAMAQASAMRRFAEE